MDADVVFLIIFYYPRQYHVSKWDTPFATSAFSVTRLTAGTILKTIFENQGLT